MVVAPASLEQRPGGAQQRVLSVRRKQTRPDQLEAPSRMLRSTFSLPAERSPVRYTRAVIGREGRRVDAGMLTELEIENFQNNGRSRVKNFSSALTGLDGLDGARIDGMAGLQPMEAENKSGV